MSRPIAPHPGVLPPSWRFAVDLAPHPGQVLVVARGPSGTTCQAATVLRGVGAAAMYVAALAWTMPGGFVDVGPSADEEAR